MTDINRHNEEIEKCLRALQGKPLLNLVYRAFHEKIAQQLPKITDGQIVEIGSGATDISKTIPGCVRTDLFPKPWIDQVENIYSLSFADQSLSAVILFDVFHHLRHPGTALEELHRVLLPKGRVIIFEPCLSFLGLLVYGFFHHEPLGLNKPIQWMAPSQWSPNDIDYYAAQANAMRIFFQCEKDVLALGWTVLKKIRFSGISYIASGGYSKIQLYPYRAFKIMEEIDSVCDLVPQVFATRLLVVLEKNRQEISPSK